MRNLLIISGIVIISVVIGVGLFFFGPSSLQLDVNTALVSAQNPVSTIPFTILEQGSRAISIKTRTNYRITSVSDLAALWPIIYGERDAPRLPNIDFTKYEVLAVFDGTHSTGGYTIKVTGIVDKDPIRTVTITHSIPDSSCSVTDAVTSPFEIIEVPKTANTINHMDVSGTSICATY